MLQLTTNLTGTFEFYRHPGGRVHHRRLRARQQRRPNVRRIDRARTASDFDVGDLVLDNTGAARRLDRSGRSVGRRRRCQPAIAVTFSEPMRPSTFRASTGGNLLLLDGATPVPLLAPTYSNGNRTVTFARAGAPQRRGIHVHDPRRPGRARGTRPPICRCSTRSSSTFTTADNIPPAVVEPESRERRAAGLARRQRPCHLLRSRSPPEH